MQIIDKYGYLKNALDYIEKNIIVGRGLHKIAQKLNADEKLLKDLSRHLKNFSETSFLTALEEKLEEKHSSIAGAATEVYGADLSVQTHKGKAFVLMILKCYIVSDDEKEDKVAANIQIFSQNDIKIKII